MTSLRNPKRQPEGVPTGGQFAADTKAEASGVALHAAPSPTRDPQWFQERLDERELITAALEEHPDNESEDYRALDLKFQRSSMELAAGAVLRDYPDAQTLVMRENEDGENQYDVLAIRDANGTDIVGPEDEDEYWEENLIGEQGSPELGSMAWAADIHDDAWAEGIADITWDRSYGKTAVLDVHAALNQDGIR